MGPYDGITGSAVDRIGRNQRDVLNTAYTVHESGRLLITYGHEGPWNLDDPNDEMRWSMESFGARMELRAIRKRNRARPSVPVPPDSPSRRTGTGTSSSACTPRPRSITSR
ncbi:hypothetical protein ACGFZK_12025 [Streptomyces sp. NPDC048257]|uniref:hypothetical protein n=1 Tax=Streptomyces sp. NPDC048257 TaxID=3365526 RepID=UPI00371D85BF